MLLPRRRPLAREEMARLSAVLALLWAGAAATGAVIFKTPEEIMRGMVWSGQGGDAHHRSYSTFVPGSGGWSGNPQGAVASSTQKRRLSTNPQRTQAAIDMDGTIIVGTMNDASKGGDLYAMPQAAGGGYVAQPTHRLIKENKIRQSSSRSVGRSFTSVPLLGRLNDSAPVTSILLGVTGRDLEEYDDTRVYRLDCLHSPCNVTQMKWVFPPWDGSTASNLGKLEEGNSVVFGDKGAAYFGTTQDKVGGVAAKGGGYTRLYAVDYRTGDELWHFPPDCGGTLPCVAGTPDFVAGNLQDSAKCIPCTDLKLQNYLHQNCETTGGCGIVKTPVVSGAAVALDATTGAQTYARKTKIFFVAGVFLYCVQDNLLDGDNRKPEKCPGWAVDGKSTWFVGLSTAKIGTQKFRSDARNFGTEPAAPVLYDANTVIVASGKVLFAIDANNGKTLATFSGMASEVQAAVATTGPRYWGDSDSALCDVECARRERGFVGLVNGEHLDCKRCKGFVYFGSRDEFMYRVVFDPNVPSFELSWKAPTAKLAKIKSTPLIYGGVTLSVVFSSTQGNLYRLPARRPKFLKDFAAQRIVDTAKWAGFSVMEAKVNERVGVVLTAGGDAVFGASDGNLYTLDGGSGGGCAEGMYHNTVVRERKPLWSGLEPLSVNERTDLAIASTNYGYQKGLRPRYWHANATAAGDRLSAHALCLQCPMGYVSEAVSGSNDLFVAPQAGVSKCLRCRKGRWRGGDAGIARGSCLDCRVGYWCPGGGNCSFGRSGDACGVCAKGYFTMGGVCKLCPETSVPTMILVFGVIGLALWFVFKHTKVSAYTAGTKFTTELRKGDTIRVSYKVGKSKVVEQRRVEQIMHDYQINVSANAVGARNKDFKQRVTKQTYMYLRQTKDGKMKWKPGSGLINLVPSSTGEEENPFTDPPFYKVWAGHCRRLCPQKKSENEHHEGSSSDDEEPGAPQAQLVTVVEGAEPDDAKADGDPSTADAPATPKSGRGLTLSLKSLRSPRGPKTPGSARTPTSGRGSARTPASGREQNDMLNDNEDEEDKTFVIRGKVQSATQIIGTALVLVIGYFQMVALFMSYEMNWPPMVKGLSTWFSAIVSFNIPDLMTSPECSWSFDSRQKYLLSVSAPISLVFVFAVIYAKSKYLIDPAKRLSAQNRCVQAIVIVTTILYVYATSQTVGPLVCTEQKEGEDTYNTMDTDPSVHCCNPLKVGECDFISSGHRTTETYRLLWFVSVFSFMCYGIGVPAGLYLVMSKAQKYKKFSDPNFVQRYGWLYLRFNRDFWYWEIVMMVRKCLIVIIKVVYAKTPKTQAEGSIFILVLFLIPTYYTKPFICYNCLKQHKKRCKHFSANDKLECGILGGSIAMLMFGMLNMDGGGGAGELVFGIIMVLILLSSIAFMARMLYKAQLEQKREERALMRSGNTGTADRNMTGNLSSMMSLRI